MNVLLEPIRPSNRGNRSDTLIRLYCTCSKSGYGTKLTGNVIVYPEHSEAPENAALHAPHEIPLHIEIGEST